MIKKVEIHGWHAPDDGLDGAPLNGAAGKVFAGAALFLILDGKVAVEMCRQRNTTILAILDKGAFFGEMALLNEAPRSANARSLERTYTLALYRNDLSRLI